LIPSPAMLDRSLKQEMKDASMVSGSHAQGRPVL
jgi:hypothetical protein